MSRMGDLRIYLTEKIQKLIPELTWEEAEDLLESLNRSNPELIREWTIEYLKNES